MTVVIDSMGDYAAAMKTPQLPMFLYLDAPDPTNHIVQKRLEETIDKYERQNFKIIVDEGPMGQKLNKLFAAWLPNKKGPADEVLEDALEEYNLYGVLHVTANQRNRVTGSTIFSERPDAKNRRFVDRALAPALPYLLVNDHPAKSDPLVIERIKSIVKTKQDQGWTILTGDTDAEAEIRGALPSGPIGEADKLPARLLTILMKHKLGGVLWIEATQGDGPPHERVRVVPIDLAKIAGPNADALQEALDLYEEAEEATQTAPVGGTSPDADTI